MLHVFVMPATETGAVGGIERCSALPDAHDVVNLDPSPAGIANALELTRADYPPWLRVDKVGDIPAWLLRDHCTKACRRCGECKPLSAYHRLSSARDGRHSCCKACRKGGV